MDFDALLSDDLKANYQALREERGWTWDDLADSFAAQGAPDMEKWARGQHVSNRAEPKARETATKKAPAKRG